MGHLRFVKNSGEGGDVTHKETIVLKFGGAAVASVENFSKIAKIILNKSLQFRVAVVVSAMGDTTDQLLGLAREVHPNPPLREQDMLVSVGERISVALLAMALDLLGQEAISLTGSQSGIITSSTHAMARILEVRPQRILKGLEVGKIVIVAGFQGVSREGEITTLGRGGSDTTAVALGVALGASKVEFYKDVAGIYSEDPKKSSDAALYSELARGAKVLDPRSVSLASKNSLPLHVLSFYDPNLLLHPGTLIGPGKKLSRGPSVFESETDS
jgi:aspartate kinase